MIFVNVVKIVFSIFCGNFKVVCYLVCDSWAGRRLGVCGHLSTGLACRRWGKVRFSLLLIEVGES